VQLELLTAMLS